MREDDHDVSGLEDATSISLVTRRGVFPALSFGQRSAPALIGLHGFPDLPEGLAPLASRLARAGHHVVLPYARGHVPAPCDGPLDPDALADDVIAIAEQLSPQAPVTLLGHGLGAVTTYAALSRSTGHFRAGVTLSMPHPRAFLSSLWRSAEQRRRAWSMGVLQLPVMAERRFAANDWTRIDELWSRWSPSLRLPLQHLARIKRCFALSMPAPLVCHRAMLRPAIALLHAESALIHQPVLHLRGEDDGCITSAASEEQARYFKGSFHQESLAQCGHFLALERPDELAALTLAWLRSRS